MSETTTSAGRQAEAAAAVYLQERGLTILARNVRTRFYELDLVACGPGQQLHFIEVKYRRSSDFGSGFDYITKDKINRLKRAALAYLAEYRPRCNGYQIDVVSVAGDPDQPKIDYLPNAINS